MKSAKVGLGFYSRGTNSGVAVGIFANGDNYGAAVGRKANGYSYGAAVGYTANGYGQGAVIGNNANGYEDGVAIGYGTHGTELGIAIGKYTKGDSFGVAVGGWANGTSTNIAIGYFANAKGGINRIAIGKDIDNDVNNTTRIRGTLYLDGGTGIVYRSTFGSGNWISAKAFTIDHPLDPENKILRHFCLEGPQVWNVYAGNVQLVNGQAVVQLPDYYSALNLVGSEIYSLTPIGGAFPVGVRQKVKNNRFLIVSKEDGEVSWTIKVLRNDPGCLEDLRRRPVEQNKR
jgi:hypothetical protein